MEDKIIIELENAMQEYKEFKKEIDELLIILSGSQTELPNKFNNIEEIYLKVEELRNETNRLFHNASIKIDVLDNLKDHFMQISSKNYGILLQLDRDAHNELNTIIIILEYYYKLIDERLNLK